MTVQEMQKYVQQHLGAMDSPPESDDVIRYINKAIHKFIVNHFEPRANRLGLGFEQSIKRIEDLRDLITTTEQDTSEVSQSFVSDIYADKADIPDNSFLLLSVGLKVFYNSNGISYSVNNGKREPDGVLDTDYAQLRVSGKFVQHDDIYKVLSDPFNKPRITKGIFTIDDDSVYSYTDDTFITDKIVLSYIRQPAKVSLKNNVDCDLSESVHEDIVDLAVKLILQDKGMLQSPEAQASNN